MAIVMQVRVATGTSKQLAAIELSGLAKLTQCVISCAYEEIDLVVSPGQSAECVEKAIDHHRELVRTWREQQLKNSRNPPQGKLIT